MKVAKESIFITISRYLKQREIDKINERLAELDERISYWSTKVNAKTGAIPSEIAYSMADLRGEKAKLLVRRDRLKGFITSSY